MLSAWHQAVAEFRRAEGNARAVRDNYFDLPVRAAAERYAQSEEFGQVLKALASSPSREVLDFGAGNGVATFAFAKRHWHVTALEPDSSPEVGAEAIRRLIDPADSAFVQVVQSGDTTLPFADETFGAVHGRQVLHHVPDLRATLAELRRVLKRRGLLLATREHVAGTPEELNRFLAEHPLHSRYGGENAYSLEHYQRAIRDAGLRLIKTWGPVETVINYYPGSEAQRIAFLRELLARKVPLVGKIAGRFPPVLGVLARWVSLRDRTPGRLFTFLAQRP